MKNLKQVLHQLEFDLARLPALLSQDTQNVKGFKAGFESCYELQAVCKSFGHLSLFITEPSLHSIWLQIISELRVHLSLALQNIGLSFSAYSRLAFWERYWIILQWRHGFKSFEKHLLDLEDLKLLLSVCKAMTILTIHMKTDPQWAPASIQQARNDFFAEQSLCFALNHYATDLNFKSAPLEADILLAIDFSVRRPKPNKASAWFQFSLSSEKGLNTKKLQQIKNSPAIALLSPYTLAKFIGTQFIKAQTSKDQSSSPEAVSEDNKVHAFYDALHLSTKWSDLVHADVTYIEPLSRELAQLMKDLFAVPKGQLKQASNNSKAYLAPLCGLIQLFIEQYLGKKARRKYAPFKVEHEEHPLIAGLLSQDLES